MVDIPLTVPKSRKCTTTSYATNVTIECNHMD